MRIHRLTLRDFRGVTERTIAPAATGVTIVQGDNEAGKTSIVEALDLLLDYRDDSQAAAVRATKPVHADVGAFVEAELSAGPYRFTYAKRFHRERSTTLTVHEPAPEQRTGREAHERVNRILDEHVDRQLWAALRLHQGVALDQADLSEGTSLAAALDTAAGAGLGGDRESSVFERVRQEHERYSTAKAGRPTKIVTDAAAAEAQAQDRADALSTELDALDADVERDAVLGQLVDERRNALAAQRRRAGELDEEARALERRASEVDRLRLESELADAASTRAAEDLAARERLVAELAAAEAEVAAAEPAVAAVAEDLAAGRARLEEAQLAAAAALARRDEARGALQEAEDVREALLLHDQLDGLAQRLARAQAAQQERLAAHARLERLGVDDAGLAAVEAAERDAGAAAAALEVDAAGVTVAALVDTAIAVGEDAPTSLAAGERTEHRVGDVLRLRVGELAEVVVAGGVSARERAERHAGAQASLARRCAELGVADPEAARAAHRARRDALRAIDAAEAQLDAALGELPLEVLADRVQRLRERIGGTARGALADADAAEDAVRDHRKALLEAEDLAEDARRALRTAEDALAGLRAEEERLVQGGATARRRRSDLEAALAAARAAVPDRALATALAERETAALAARAAYGEAATGLASSDPGEARAAADNALAVAERLGEELRSAEDERRDVRSRLELRGEQGLHDAFEAARRAHEQAARDHQRIRAQAAAARLLYERMAAHRDAARRAYAAPFRDKLERLAAIVFGDGVRLELDEELRIASRTLGGVTLAYDQLSSGAREQLAVLARLACAAIVGRDGGVPLVLDDALGYSDPTRLERLGAALRVGARETQVIVLTCVPERYHHVGEATVVRL